MRSNLTSFEQLESRLAPSTFTVTTVADAGAGSLRQALADADNHAGPDKIVFHLPAPPVNGENTILLTGELTSKGNVTIAGPGAGKLIIDANSTGRVFNIDDGDLNADSPATISGLSIIRGVVAGLGGGVFSQESLTLTNVTVTGNSAGGGGGVVVEGSLSVNTTAKISNSLVTGNSSTGYAGGIDLFGVTAISIKKTIVTGNTATNNDGGGIYAAIISSGTGIAISGCVVNGNKAATGGGIVVKSPSSLPNGKVKISSTTVAGNTSTSTGADGGGGIFVRGGRAVITGCKILNNTAVNNGGGIAANGFASLTIAKSTVSGNQTTSSNAYFQGGGGIFVYGSGLATPQPVTIIGSQVIGNRSARFGGGLFGHAGIALTISSSTFSSNRAGTFGGGLQVIGDGLDKVDLTVSVSTFSSNFASQSGGAIDAFGDGRIAVSSSKLTGNITLSQGGAMYLKSGAATDGLILKNVTVNGNTASSNGGGIKIVDTPDFRIIGGTFTNNRSGSSGGGIAVGGSTGSILGTKISGNVAFIGGGISQAGTGTVTLDVDKVNDNTAPINPNVSGTFTFV